MPIDYKSLKKLESVPASAQRTALDNAEHLLVLIKFREPGRVPDYVTPRSQIGPQIVSAEIIAGDLQRLEAEPNVESVSVSRRIPLMQEQH